MKNECFVTEDGQSKRIEWRGVRTVFWTIKKTNEIKDKKKEVKY